MCACVNMCVLCVYVCTLVCAGNRNRYIQDGYNLDLTYITDR